MRASSLVAEVVSDWREAALVALCLLPSRELLLHVVSNELLCLNLRDLSGTLDFPFEEQLLLEKLRKSGV